MSDPSLGSGFRSAAGIALCAATLGGLAALGCTGDARGVEVGDQVPEYSAPSLTGEEVAFADHLGEVVLINVWATWCGPCRVEMPPIQNIYSRFNEQGFTVLAVSIDTGPGYREKVDEFVREFELDFPILLDPESRIGRVLQTVGVPETFVLDREGRIIKRLIGATDWDSEANQALIRELLRM
ncbi:MAG: TlpA family protein disulfide reductase [Gemmatimonadota bacterium]|nr:MAG: TlpA family protein disulfide reductase [Gemmatimonadota bacterium]